MAILKKAIPIIIALVTFVILAGIVIGIGQSEKSIPRWIVALLVFMAGGVTFWGYKVATNRLRYSQEFPNYAQKSSMNPPIGIPLNQPIGIPMQYQKTPQQDMPPPIMPASIMPA